MTEVVEEKGIHAGQRSDIFQQLLSQALLLKRESGSGERQHRNCEEYDMPISSLRYGQSQCV